MSECLTKGNIDALIADLDSASRDYIRENFSAHPLCNEGKEIMREWFLNHLRNARFKKWPMPSPTDKG